MGVEVWGWVWERGGVEAEEAGEGERCPRDWGAGGGVRGGVREEVPWRVDASVVCSGDETGLG